MPRRRSREKPPDLDGRIAKLKDHLSTIQSFFNHHEEHLRKQIRNLRKIIEKLEDMHENTTTGSLVGGVIGAAGGIASLVGVALAPFTFGASLTVTEVGVGIAAAGGITGAASNISKNYQSNTFQKEINDIVNDCKTRLSPVISSVNNIKTIVPAFEADLNTGIIFSSVAQIVRLAATARRTFGVIGRTIPVLSAFTLILDTFSIADDAAEIHQIRMRKQGKRYISSAMLKFIDEMNNTVTQLEQTLGVLKAMKHEADEALTELEKVKAELLKRRTQTLLFGGFLLLFSFHL